MTEPETYDPQAPMLPELDTEPRVWTDEHPAATEDEVALGNALGATINPNDDDDNGAELLEGEL